MFKRVLKKAAITIGILSLVVGGAVIVFSDPGPVRMFDAQWRPLAWSQAEGYCAGRHFDRQNLHPDPAVEECIQSVTAYSSEPEMYEEVLPAFCQGIYENLGMAHDKCQMAVDQYDLWPLYKGGITTDWGPGHERPNPIEGDIERGNVRGGERDADSRGDF